MFAGRYRQNKRELKSPSSAQPGAESNSRYTVGGELDEPNTLPPIVNDVMSVVRLNWDFMTVSEVKKKSRIHCVLLQSLTRMTHWLL